MDGMSARTLFGFVLGLVVIATLNQIDSAQTPDPHQSVASDGSSAPPLETGTVRIEPFAGTSTLGRRGSRPGSKRPGVPFLAVSRNVPQQVIGDDDRKRIASPNPYPYRAVVYVNASESCTGWLIGSDTVITAGHCVHSGSSFASVSGVMVASSSDGESGRPSTPFPTCAAKRLYSTLGWTSMKDEAYDYGAIKLDCAGGAMLGDVVGWLGAADQPSPTGKRGRVVAYDPDGTQTNCRPGTWRSLCSALGGPMKTTADQLFYDADVEKGGSGAPVFIGNALTVAVGIHGYGPHGDGATPHDTLNHGVLITHRVLQNLLAWRTATVP
jgi:glutamyl endopeptidase